MCAIQTSSSPMLEPLKCVCHTALRFAVVLLQLQSSCPPLVESAILAYQRDPSVPGVNNITFPKHEVWDGREYEGSIHYIDFSTRMAGGENLFESGYVVQKLDTYKVKPAVGTQVLVSVLHVCLRLVPTLELGRLQTSRLHPCAAVSLATGALHPGHDVSC